jgi:hypothetical protein
MLTWTSTLILGADIDRSASNETHVTNEKPSTIMVK